MFIKLLIVFATVPLIELALLIKIGEFIGIIPTIIIVGSTGIIGITLARSQGYQVIKKIKNKIELGKLPADDLIGGVLILIGGTMLLTPGILTDITGFSLIFPITRSVFVKIAKNKIKKYIENNRRGIEI
ncbi:MAG TPA: FxsA family protein [Halanaerobiales bacterium]|nr:FxsA family protein [Halanaerobiales bacterium]